MPSHRGGRSVQSSRRGADLLLSYFVIRLFVALSKSVANKDMIHRAVLIGRAHLAPVLCGRARLVRASSSASQCGPCARRPGQMPNAISRGRQVRAASAGAGADYAPAVPASSGAAVGDAAPGGFRARQRIAGLKVRLPTCSALRPPPRKLIGKSRLKCFITIYPACLSPSLLGSLETNFGLTDGNGHPRSATTLISALKIKITI